MSQYGFYFDSARCTGCKTCVMACKDYHDLGVDNSYRRVYDCEGGTWRANADGSLTQDCFVYHISMGCNHCASPVCVKVCPTGAMHKGEAGVVAVNERRCIGCGYCTLACPYHAPRIDPNLKKSSKCNACAERVAAGLRPICVEACPLRAIEFGEISELRERHEGSADIPLLPSSHYTAPSYVVGFSPAVNAAGLTAGFIANMSETE